SSTWGKLYIRKLVGSNFQTMVELVTNSDSGEECTSGTLEVEAGYYQLYFSSWVNMDNTPANKDNWAVASTNTQAYLNINPIPVQNIADINGDGIVDGADLARVLGSWGTSASGGDLNGDGIVDGADLAIVLANWT
ncbi:MAG: hypothetical protein MK085_11880, partial [Phycisphaerales bacterium]|nr:hypothetical protein [Phycisphaerales bacterium]